MAEGKISIEIYKNKNAEDFTKLLSDAQGKLETGSASAYTAAMASALMIRAAAITAQTVTDNDRLDYIIRTYMVHLIDEDVKCRGPLKKAIKEGGEREIEACRQPACCINAEIVNMMGQALGFLRELAEMGAKDAMHYIGEASELALGAVKCSRKYIIDMSSKCSDETYRFVTRRENDVALGQCMAAYEDINDKVEDAI